MKLSTGFILALIIALLVIGFITQHLWLKSTKLDEQLTDSTATLKTARQGISALNGVVDGLVTDTSRKGRTIDRQGGQIATLQKNVAQAQSKALQQAFDTRKSDTVIGQQVASADAKAKKAAADEWVGGIGPIPTTVNDTAMNRIAGTLKGVIKNRDNVVVPGLVSANEQLSQQLADEKARGLDLVTELNGPEGIVARQAKVIADTRSLTQNEIAKASKGIVRKVVNGPRIKALTKVDAKLAEGQKP